jgi:hypothetical protein
VFLYFLVKINYCYGDSSDQDLATVIWFGAIINCSLLFFLNIISLFFVRKVKRKYSGFYLSNKGFITYFILFENIRLYCQILFCLNIVWLNPILQVISYVVQIIQAYNILRLKSPQDPIEECNVINLIGSGYLYIHSYINK